MWLDQKNRQLDRAYTALDQQKKEVDRTNVELTQAKAAVEDRKKEVERTNTELVSTNKTLDEQKKSEKRQRLLAEQSLLRTCACTTTCWIIRATAPRKIASQNDPTYQRLLDKFVHDADEMLTNYPDNSAVVQLAARSHLERASKAPSKGLSKAITDDLEIARQYYEQLHAKEPDNPMFPGRLGQVHIQRALRAYDVKDYPEAHQSFAAAFDTIAPWAGADPARDGGLNAAGLNLVCRSLSQLEMNTGMPTADVVIQRLEKAIALLEPGENDHTNLPQRTYFTADLRLLQVQYLLKRGDQAAAIAVLERAMLWTEKRDGDAYAVERGMLHGAFRCGWPASRCSAAARRRRSAGWRWVTRR